MNFSFENFLSLFSGLLTPLIAIITIYIAWRQWKTSQDKLTLEKYDRRLQIYKEVAKILTKILRDADISYEDLAVFRTSVFEADFVFEPEIVEFIDEIYRRGVALHSWNEQYARARRIEVPDYDHQNVVDGMHEELVWLTNQLEPLKGKFMKYMKLGK